MYLKQQNQVEDRSLGAKVKEIQRTNKKPIPKIIRFIENPSGKFSLPGKCSLYNHDCLHLILHQGFSLPGEAYVIGFCMGSDIDTNWLHLFIFKIFSRYLYPREYQFDSHHFPDFSAGFNYARSLTQRNINRLNFEVLAEYEVEEIRSLLEINLQELEKNQHFSMKPKRNSNKYNLGEIFKWASSMLGILGGFLLALNLKVSPYGFLILATSSFSMLVSSCINKDKGLIFYSLSIFLFVDLLGIYRWIIN